MRFSFLAIFFLFVTGCGPASPTTVNNNVSNTKATLVPSYTYDIVATYPHDPKAFTQGLVFRDGVMYEGTGGQDNDPYTSSLRKVELATGKVLQKHDLPREIFGEGIALLGDKIFQLTWTEGKAFVYERETFRLLQEFSYSGEGWGLTEDGTNLYQSDGTHVIRVVDPATFKTIKTIVVKDERGNPVMQLNELEWVKGEIWANVWQKGWILRIDPNTGNLLGRIDLNKVTDEEQRGNKNADVLNGIAYDAQSDRLFVTGKLWTRLFEIKLKPAS